MGPPPTAFPPCSGWPSRNQDPAAGTSGHHGSASFVESSSPCWEPLVACKASLLTPPLTSSTSEADSGSPPIGLATSTRGIHSIFCWLGSQVLRGGGRQHQSTDWVNIFWDDVRRDLACFADKEKQLISMLDCSLGSIMDTDTELKPLFCIQLAARTYFQLV